MKPRTRIASGFGIVIIALVAVAGFYQYALTATAREYTQLLEANAEIAAEVDAIDSLTARCRLAAAETTADATDATLAAESEAVAVLREEAGRLTELAAASAREGLAARAATMKDIAARWAEGLDALAAYRVKINKITGYRSVGDMPKVHKKWFAAATDRLDEIETTAEQIRSAAAAGARQAAARVARAADQRNAMAVALAMVAMLAGILVASRVGRSITRTILTGAGRDLSASDHAWHHIAGGAGDVPEATEIDSAGEAEMNDDFNAT